MRPISPERAQMDVTVDRSHRLLMIHLPEMSHGLHHYLESVLVAEDHSKRPFLASGCQVFSNLLVASGEPLQPPPILRRVPGSPGEPIGEVHAGPKAIMKIRAPQTQRSLSAELHIVAQSSMDCASLMSWLEIIHWEAIWDATKVNQGLFARGTRGQRSQAQQKKKARA